MVRLAPARQGATDKAIKSTEAGLSEASPGQRL